MSASCDELRLALRETLEARGVLGELRARLRSEIFSAIDAGADAPVTGKRKELPLETVVVSELFRDFLRFTGYTQTLSVFDAEAGTTQTELTRENLAHDLGVALNAEAASLPLIYAILEAIKRVKSDKIRSL